MKNSTFKFLGYRVTDSELHVKDGYVVKDALSADIKTEYEIIDKDKRVVDIWINVRLKSDDLSCDVTVKGTFQGDPEMTEEEFKGLYSKNSILILFPYVRAAICNYTATSGIQPIILPLINTAEFEAHERGGESTDDKKRN